MQYSTIIKSIKYFLVFLSISIFTVLIINSATQQGADQNSLITFESEEFSSTSQVLTKPLFMGLDKKQQPFKISAQKATRFTDSDNIFNLEKPNGEIEKAQQYFFVRKYPKVEQGATVFVDYTDRKKNEAESDYYRDKVMSRKQANAALILICEIVVALQNFFCNPEPVTFQLFRTVAGYFEFQTSECDKYFANFALQSKFLRLYILLRKARWIF